MQKLKLEDLYVIVCKDQRGEWLSFPVDEHGDLLVLFGREAAEEAAKIDREMYVQDGQPIEARAVPLAEVLEPARIVVEIQGGCVRCVRGLPVGWELAVHDYDVPPTSARGLTDEYGDRYHEITFKSVAD